MSDAPAPLVCVYEGDGKFAPAGPVWAKKADQRFVVGDRYLMEVREPRSQASHNHYFAAIHDGWINLPDELHERFPTEDHLRKFALIKSGWRDERSIACASKAEALRLAAVIKSMDDFAIVVVTASVVTVYTAKTQAMKAMGKRDFQKSKDDVLGVIDAMLKLARGTLAANAGKAA